MNDPYDLLRSKAVKVVHPHGINVSINGTCC
jgi:hypothetical protein